MSYGEITDLIVALTYLLFYYYYLFRSKNTSTITRMHDTMSWNSKAG